MNDVKVEELPNDLQMQFLTYRHRWIRIKYCNLHSNSTIDCVDRQTDEVSIEHANVEFTQANLSNKKVTRKLVYFLPILQS